jgi:hypothetical protein
VKFNLYGGREMAEEEIKEVPKKKKVAIVGCASSKDEAPFDDDSFEIWGVNNLFHLIPRADRWFEIHELTQEGELYKRRGKVDFRGENVKKYMKGLGDWAAKNNCPVYMQKEWDIIPTSKAYPIQEVLEKFGNYFTNTISYEIALAILEGFEEIHIYGVDMAVDTEYFHQRPSCEYFIGLAMGMGIKVHVPLTADLLKTRFLYGFQEPETRAFNAKCNAMEESMSKKQNKLENEKYVTEAKLNQFIGARQALKEIKKIHG